MVRSRFGVRFRESTVDPPRSHQGSRSEAMLSAPPLRPTSILLTEPEKSLVLKLQDLLMGHFQTALDFAIAGSLREGMTHLCTHPVTSN